MRNVREKIITQVKEYYGDDDEKLIQSKSAETSASYENFLNNRISYKQFLKSNPHVLYAQRRSMLYNLLNGWSTASKTTRRASLFEYSKCNYLENTKIHRILFVDDSSIFPGAYEEIFNTDSSFDNYLNLMVNLAYELGIPFDKLGTTIMLDLIRYLKNTDEYISNRTPKRIYSTDKFHTVCDIVGVDVLTPILHALSTFKSELLSDHDKSELIRYFNFMNNKETDYSIYTSTNMHFF